MKLHAFTFQRLWLALSLLAAALLPSPAFASVDIIFYSREWGARFPHAFILLSGTDERTGQKVDANFGFTAKRISPAVLLGSVSGTIVSESRAYIASSDAHFRMRLSDDQYRAVLASVARWRRMAQPSYSLESRNCVHFVADIAATLGMGVERPAALMKKPRSYLESLTASNRTWLADRGGSILRVPARPEWQLRPKDAATIARSKGAKVPVR